MPLVSEEEQEKFKNAKVTVIGCGGIGGLTIDTAAMTVTKQGEEINLTKKEYELVLVDEDAFDLSNLNRQTLSTHENIGQAKSEVAEKRVREINPYVTVTSYREHVDGENIDKLIRDSRIVIDALDNVLTRVIVSRKAREYRIPFIHGTLGQITTFLPNTKSYEEMFNLPSLGKELTDDVVESLKNVTTGPPPVIGPVPNLVSCLQAMEAYKIITGIAKTL